MEKNNAWGYFARAIISGIAISSRCVTWDLWQNAKMDRNAKEWKERKVQKNFNGRNGRKKIEQNATILCHELLFLKAIVNTSDSLPMSNRQFPIY